MPIQLKFRRGTAAFWTAMNPTLKAGEIAIETDTQLFKIGDGSTAWIALGYAGIDGPAGNSAAQFTVTNGTAGRVLTSDGTSSGAIAQANLFFDSTSGTLSTTTLSTLQAVCTTFTTVNLSTSAVQTGSMNVKTITCPDAITMQTDSVSIVGSNLVVVGDITGMTAYNTMTYDYPQLAQALTVKTLDASGATLSRLWTGIEISGTGQYQIAGMNGTGIYVSTDYGATWTVKNTAAGALTYESPGLSKCGRYMTAPVSGASGALYRSADYGQTWAVNASAGTANWCDVSMSATGQYQTAVAATSGLYVSTDYGQTWQRSSAPTTPQWTSVAVSATGQYQIAVSSYVASPLVYGCIYVSSDYGQTWVLKSASTSTILYKSVAISASGKYSTIVSLGSANILTSINYGLTWVSKSTATARMNVAMTDSGQYQIACLSAAGAMVVSSDYGATWTAKGITTNTWRAVGLSGSGQYMTAVAATAAVAGLLYTRILPTYFADGITVSSLCVGPTYSTSTYALQLTTNSAAKPATSTWKISSDMRIKTDIEPANIEVCYSTIRALQMKYYEWDPNLYSADVMKDRHVLGFIAQEVKHVFPKSVNIHDTFQIGHSTLTDFHTLNVDQIQAANIGAVKRLMEIVGNQEETVSSLTGRYDAQQSTFTSQFELRQSTIDGYLAMA